MFLQVNNNTVLMAIDTQVSVNISPPHTFILCVFYNTKYTRILLPVVHTQPPANSHLACIDNHFLYVHTPSCHKLYKHAASYCLVNIVHTQPPAQAAISLRMVIDIDKVVETAIAYLLSRIVIRAMDVDSPQQFAMVNNYIAFSIVIMIYSGCGGCCRHTD